MQTQYVSTKRRKLNTSYPSNLGNSKFFFFQHLSRIAAKSALITGIQPTCRNALTMGSLKLGGQNRRKSKRTDTVMNICHCAIPWPNLVNSNNVIWLPSFEVSNWIYSIETSSILKLLHYLYKLWCAQKKRCMRSYLIALHEIMQWGYPLLHLSHTSVRFAILVRYLLAFYMMSMCY